MPWFYIDMNVMIWKCHVMIALSNIIAFHNNILLAITTFLNIPNKQAYNNSKLHLWQWNDYVKPI